MSSITEEIRAKATELYHGNDVCMAQARRLFKDVGFPNGLIPLRDVEECGYVEETGFVWIKQKKAFDHKFEKIGKKGRYAAEITAYVEPGKISKLTGVKGNEIIIWVSVNEITVEGPERKSIVFKNEATGVKKIYPIDAFMVESDEPAVEKVPIKKAEAKEKKEAAAAVVVIGVGAELNGKEGAATSAFPMEVKVKEV